MECRIRTTCLAALGLPAQAAICPYVITFPSGIAAMIATTCFVNGVIISAPVSEKKFKPAGRDVI
jgi:hypothetical protein